MGERLSRCRNPLPRATWVGWVQPPRRAADRAASALCSLILLLSACGDAGAPPHDRAVVDTLLDGLVRVSNTAGEGADPDMGIRLIPELSLGVAEQEGPELFGSISALEVGADGRIFVLDRQANELRIFGADGRHERTVGRTGEGPGEYVRANGLLWAGPDTPVVVDQSGRRYSLLTADGDYVRSVRRPHGWIGYAFSGGYHQGRVLERTDFSDPAGDPEEARPMFVAVGLAEPAGAPVDTLFLPMPTGPVVQAFPTPPGWWIPIPFTPVATYRLDQNGRLLHGHGERFRILRGELDGTVTREILLEVESARVTEDELREWEEGVAVQRYLSMVGEALDTSLIPDHKPYFDDLHPGWDGSVWASVPSPPMHLAWQVFDSVGIHLGRAELTGFDAAPAVPPVIRHGRLHLAVEDELEVPRVRVYRVEY